jgi:hypothetical protein
MLTLLNADESVQFSVFDEAKEAAILHYTKSFKGFSAIQTEKQAQQLAGTVFSSPILCFWP